MFTLSQIAKLLNGKLNGPDASFESISTDTRTLKPGELFVALVGPNFNANRLVADAATKKAVGALVSEPVSSAIPTVQVEDTRIALGQLAAFHRQQFQIPVIGLTGSCGKTTTKSMLANILQQCGSTLATEGTLNNDIGVPKTLLRLRTEHQFAVIEMGANHAGEIAYVADMAKPTIAFITNVAPAHLEGFGDLPGVARAKGEIFQSLPAHGAVIINADDAFAGYWRENIGSRPLLTFGLRQPAEYTAKQVQINKQGYAEFLLCTPLGEVTIQLPILGEHNIMNALAAAAAAQTVGASLAAIKKGLETFKPVYQRLVVQAGYAGATIIDDSYNANPLSVTAALNILAQKSGEKIFAFGEMRELGPNAAQYHQQIGETAKALGINRLYAYGDLTELTVRAFGEQGYHFAEQAELISAIRQQLHAGVTVLVKGSLSTGMKNVVAGLIKE
jgi:UDP-N-acetylmuramoyl-tripeptide--D-alanyl-D-alanine ligase